MNIEDFLALPLQPSIRLRYGPGVDDAVQISVQEFENRKAELIDYCHSLGVAGQNWEKIRAHTGGNGLMAKVLIALGDLAGAWKMHPHPDNYGWHRSSPRVLMLLEKTPPPPRIPMPKPSAGDLEEGVLPCKCCGRPMGPADSLTHDLRADPRNTRLCRECSYEDCPEEGGGPCNIFDKQPEPAPEKQAAADQPKKEDIEAYLEMMNRGQ